jgi:hypothetical protein
MRESVQATDTDLETKIRILNYFSTSSSNNVMVHTKINTLEYNLLCDEENFFQRLLLYVCLLLHPKRFLKGALEKWKWGCASVEFVWWFKKFRFANALGGTDYDIVWVNLVLATLI